MHWDSSRFKQLSNSSLLKIFVDQKSWQTPRALPFPPLPQKMCFPAYSMVICCGTADVTADIVVPYMTADCG